MNPVKKTAREAAISNRLVSKNVNKNSVHSVNSVKKSSPSVDLRFDKLAKNLNRFLYRKETRALTPAQLEMAEKWALDYIRKHHPDWDDDRVRKYYDDLLKWRVTVVDEWGRRMR